MHCQGIRGHEKGKGFFSTMGENPQYLKKRKRLKRHRHLEKKTKTTKRRANSVKRGGTDFLETGERN